MKSLPMIIQEQVLLQGTIMTESEKEECRRASLDIAHGEMIRMFLFRSCINCSNWQHEKDKCGKYDEKPPATIIVYGCDDWDIDLPF